MERFNEATIRQAYALQQELMLKGEVSRNKQPELYNAFYDPDVRSLMYNVFLPVSKAEILTQDDVLYFVPELENDLFAYSNEWLRNEMKLSNNNQLYLAQFIFIHTLGEFYGEQFHTIHEPRSFVKVEELVGKVKSYMDKFKELKDEALEELSQEHELNLVGMVEAWDLLAQETDDIKKIKMAPGRTRGFVLKVLAFWEKEKLVMVQDEEEISFTEKMKGIAGNYYNHSDRIAKIKELLQQKKNEKGEYIYA